MRKKGKQNFLLFLALATLLIILVTLVSFKSSKPLRGSHGFACRTDNFLGEFVDGERLATFEGEGIYADVAYPGRELGEAAVLSAATPSQRWIEVDLSEQKLRAWEGDRLFLETPVSTGLPWWPTPKGEFRIWIKLRYTKMEGGEGKYYYYLPNVPYVMFFENSKIPGWRGYGLHGTYWHNDFGTQRSHGCVNLPTPVAKKLFYWTTPTLPKGKWAVRSMGSNPGTRIVIHE